MRFHLLGRSKKQYVQAPRHIRAAFDKQMVLLTYNRFHPSLQVKKYDAVDEVWQGRVTLSWRFYFQIDGDVYNILSIVPHPK